MTTLAKDSPRTFENTGGHPSVNEIPIIANEIVYAGAAVGESSSSGTGRPLVGGDAFLGFATETCDNTGGSASDKRIKVLDRGRVKLTVTGASSTAVVGDSVYASDDNTFTLTSSGASSIGKVSRWVTGSVVLVDFEATTARSL